MLRLDSIEQSMKTGGRWWNRVNHIIYIITFLRTWKNRALNTEMTWNNIKYWSKRSTSKRHPNDRIGSILWSLGFLDDDSTWCTSFIPWKFPRMIWRCVDFLSLNNSTTLHSGNLEGAWGFPDMPYVPMNLMDYWWFKVGVGHCRWSCFSRIEPFPELPQQPSEGWPPCSQLCQSTGGPKVYKKRIYVSTVD